MSPTSRNVQTLQPESEDEEKKPALAARRLTGLLLILSALVVVAMASLAFGSNPLSFSQVWNGLWHPDDSEASVIVWDLRMPRTLVGILTGAAFAVAGALMQALTRNPLADPGILGVNAGASFAVTIGVALLGLTHVTEYMWFAFLGAAAATVLVYFIGSVGRGGSSTPATLVLAGVALGAFLGGITSLLRLMDPDTFDTLRMWGVGSIARLSFDEIKGIVPMLVIGLLIALCISNSLNSIALGDDLAASLGTNIMRTRVFGLIAVTILGGCATAMTGGIGFVGLMVPHIVRWFTGPDQRWVMSYSILAGPLLVLTADVVGRVIARPSEIEVGIVTAVIGAPVLIALVRRKKASGL